MIYFFLGQALDCHTSLLETAADHLSKVYIISKAAFILVQAE